jgi:2-polyprenyl-3-methyl-5-hydroxy-6-metoxy-1,4-benzoquinol methylase
MKTFSTRPKSETIQTIECNFCGCEDHRKLLHSEEYTFVQCRNCGLVFQNPQPVQDAVLNRYNDIYFDYELQNEENFFKLMLLGLRDIDFFQTVERPFEKNLVLDVGCATGKLISYLQDQGFRVKGVEVCRKAATYGMEKRNVDIVIAPLESSGFPPDSFDIVHCSHLIEHLNDPYSFFAHVSTLLKPDGMFIVSTPNIDGFQARIFRERWRSAIADHLFLFSKKTLQKYFQAFGFTIEKQKTWGGLAAGTAPKLIKAVADRVVKLVGLGDVMIFRTRNRKTEAGGQEQSE